MDTTGTPRLIVIAGDDALSREAIGAMARSLQTMTTAGLHVPPAFVISNVFFQPWFAVIERLPAWDEWRVGLREQWPALCAAIECDAVKKFCQQT
jgi:hypothetical protein